MEKALEELAKALTAKVRLETTLRVLGAVGGAALVVAAAGVCWGLLVMLRAMWF